MTARGVGGVDHRRAGNVFLKIQWRLLMQPMEGAMKSGASKLGEVAAKGEAIYQKHPLGGFGE